MHFRVLPISTLPETRMAAVTVNQIADWFIVRFRDAGDSVTNLKLQKLVYYAQAWFVAIHRERLFPESFEAWVHGPVCPPLYHRFKSHRWNPITDEVAPPALDDRVTGVLDEVMEVYGGFAGWQLEQLTHSEAPWLDARRGLAPEQTCDTEISVDAMRGFYKPKRG